MRLSTRELLAGSSMSELPITKVRHGVAAGEPPDTVISGPLGRDPAGLRGVYDTYSAFNARWAVGSLVRVMTP